MKLFQDIWTLYGTLNRVQYAFWGILLFGIKYNLGRWIVLSTSGEEWSMAAYFVRPDLLSSLSLDSAEGTASISLFLLAIPFIGLGVWITMKRLKDIGFPSLLAVFFFFPFINLLMLGLLVLIPSHKHPVIDTQKRSFVDRIIPNGAFGSAFLVSVIAGLSFAPLPFLHIPYLGYQWFMLAIIPIILGFSTVLIYNHREFRSYWKNIKAGMLSIAMIFGLLWLVIVFLSLFGFSYILGTVLYVSFYLFFVIIIAIPVLLILSMLGATIAHIVKWNAWDYN